MIQGARMCDDKLTVDIREMGTAPLTPLGVVAGEMDAILTGEEAVWVRLAKDIKPEDVMGLEVFVRVRG